MLIAHRHKFITIDIPKTGTRSLRMSLAPLGLIDVIGQPNATVDIPFKQHGSVLSAREQFINEEWEWNDYFKWSVIRNPWYRYFSFFKYYKNYLEKYTHRDESSVWTQSEINQGESCVRLFSNKTDQQVLEVIITSQPSQDTYYCDESGNIIVDHLAEFENITEEFNSFCDHIGISAPKFHHGNKSESSLTVNDVYNQQLIDLVAQKEKNVIELNEYNI